MSPSKAQHLMAFQLSPHLQVTTAYMCTCMYKHICMLLFLEGKKYVNSTVHLLNGANQLRQFLTSFGSTVSIRCCFEHRLYIPVNLSPLVSHLSPLNCVAVFIVIFSHHTIPVVLSCPTPSPSHPSSQRRCSHRLAYTDQATLHQAQ